MIVRPHTVAVPALSHSHSHYALRPSVMLTSVFDLLISSLVTMTIFDYVRGRHVVCFKSLFKSQQGNRRQH